MSKTETREHLVWHLNRLSSMGLKQILRTETHPVSVRQVAPTTQSNGTSRPSATNLVTAIEATAVVQTSEAGTLPELLARIGDCKRCKLCHGRNKLVFGDGNPHARLMLIGEGPGADEDEQGLPFVGRAGQLLTKIIESMGLTRSDVYIANVVKCRPPGNRNPEPDEIAQCMPFLQRQIELVNPEFIMCLGKFAVQTVLNTQIPISKLRGEWVELNGRMVMPVFHPAYLLRNPSMKRIMWEDCKKVMARMK